MLEQRTSAQNTYLLVNLVFCIFLVIIFLYSLVFRANNHPIPALLTDLTGEIPPSKGLSSSFSEIVRGNFELANEYNPYGLRVFSFFVAQLLMRIFFSILTFLKPKKISIPLIADITISIVIFIFCFAPLITYTLRTLFY